MFWFLLSIFFLACLGAGASGGLFPPGTWYQSLSKPNWTPPNWAFPVVWIIVYTCIALAGARAALAPENSVAMAFWAMQIAFNGLWTPVFFGLKNIRLAMGVLVVLWFSVLGAMLTLWQVDAVAGVLFLPYLLWVSVAGALNASVWRLNPEEAFARNEQSD